MHLLLDSIGGAGARPAVVLPFTAIGLLVGIACERLHRRGWYRCPGDRRPRRVPSWALPLTMAITWCIVVITCPARDVTAAILLTLHLGVLTVAVLMSAADVALHRLRDIVTVPTAVLTVLVLLAVWLLAPGSTAGSPTRAVFAGILVPALMLAASLLIGGIGFGDVKFVGPLAAILGLHGWASVLLGIVVAWILAGSLAAWLLLRGRADRATAIPLAPFLTAGTLAALLLTH